MAPDSLQCQRAHDVVRLLHHHAPLVQNDGAAAVAAGLFVGLLAVLLIAGLALLIAEGIIYASERSCASGGRYAFHLRLALDWRVWSTPAVGLTFVWLPRGWLIAGPLLVNIGWDYD